MQGIPALIIIFVSLFILYSYYGLYFLFAPFWIIILVIINNIIMNYAKHFTIARAKLNDGIGVAANEMVKGMKNIKFNVWEYVSLEKIMTFRRGEADQTKKFNLLMFNSTNLTTIIPSAIVSSIYIMRVSNQENFTISEVFFMISLCQMLVMPSTGLVRLMNFRVRSKISKARISNFMAIDTESVSNRTENLPKGTLTLQNYSATWIDPVQAEKLRNLDPTKKVVSTLQESKAILVLDDISITFQPGKLYIILGSVGSSKSSLIHALLGELSTVHGKNEMSGSVGYVPQTAFNNNDILRNNITYGREFDQDLYVDTVIKCGLYDDLEMFPSRDFTEIGERGINLSGGQK